ncbi:hypothetical protein [Cloacibacterium rupense]|nr:hypothetical protein [Cloacibacterium rupense]
MKNFLFIVLTLFTQFFFSQFNSFDSKIMVKEASLIDKEAPAEIVYNSVTYKIDIDDRVVYQKYFRRIKIYDKNRSEKWLNMSIPLYNQNNIKEKILSFEAKIYNLNQGKLDVMPIDDTSKFVQKEGKNVALTKIAFPNIKNGSVIEYSYEIKSPFIRSLPIFYVESEIPIEKSEFLLYNTDLLNYIVNYSGEIAPTKKTKEKTKFGSVEKYTFENIKPIKFENFVNNIDNYKTQIKSILSSVNIYDFELFNYNVTWDYVKNELYKNENFGQLLNKSYVARKVIDDDIKKEKNPLIKANKIFKKIKNEYVWNNNNGIFAENGFKTLISDKVGNVADINLFLVAAMREAKLKANPAITATVDYGLPNIKTPNLYSFNYIIACLELDGKIYLYDATSKNSYENLLPTRAWNSFGYVLREDKGFPIHIYNETLSDDFTTYDLTLDNQNDILANLTNHKSASLALQAKEMFDNKTDELNEYYNQNLENINIKEFIDDKFEFSAKLKSLKIIDKFNEKLVLNPILLLNSNSYNFNQTNERKYPIEFLSPINKVTKIIFRIPDDYDVLEIPKPKKIKTDDGELVYEYDVQLNQRTLVIVSKMKILSSSYPKEYYPIFKQFFEVKNNSENQSIILNKN